MQNQSSRAERGVLSHAERECINVKFVCLRLTLSMNQNVTLSASQLQARKCRILPALSVASLAHAKREQNSGT